MTSCMEDTRQKCEDRAVKQSGCNNVKSGFAYVCIIIRTSMCDIVHLN